MERKITTSILTPERILFEGDTEFAVVRAFDGDMGFLFNHAPLISELGLGHVTLRDSQSKHQFFIEGGVVQILDNNLIILAETALKKEELDKAELEAKLNELHQQDMPKFSKDWMAIRLEEENIKARLKLIQK